MLIRAIRDSNLPKFVEEDVVLFHGIVRDLFPGVEIPEQVSGHSLEQNMESRCRCSNSTVQGCRTLTLSVCDRILMSPPQNMGSLESAIYSQMRAQGLQPVDSFTRKVIQLHHVRLGFRACRL